MGLRGNRAISPKPGFDPALQSTLTVRVRDVNLGGPSPMNHRALVCQEAIFQIPVSVFIITIVWNLSALRLAGFVLITR